MLVKHTFVSDLFITETMETQTAKSCKEFVIKRRYSFLHQVVATSYVVLRSGTRIYFSFPVVEAMLKCDGPNPHAADD